MRYFYYLLTRFLGNKLIAKRRREPFYRIGRRSVIELLKIDSNTESIYNLGGNDGAFPKDMNDDNRSQFSSITNQTGVSIKTSKTMQTRYFEITPDTDFLILDLRNEDEYDNYRIKEAVNFPEPLLKRDQFLPIIYKYVRNITFWSYKLLTFFIEK